MVICKCRKTTKLYCFVHRVPVCGECICAPGHRICVIRTYSEWVIDGEYDWPQLCSLCNVSLEDGANSQTTRLGCLHVMHTNCLVSYFQCFPPQTVPSGYTCPACSSPIWPPKSIKDTGSFHTRLKEAIIQSGLEKNIFGNHLVTLPPADFRAPPPAFDTDPLTQLSAPDEREKGSKNSFDSIRDPSQPSSFTANEERYSAEAYGLLTGLDSSVLSDPEIVEIGPTSLKSSGATTRKAAYDIDRQNSENSYYADDQDANRKKYSRRGPFHHKFLRFLLPFWSTALPSLPVTAPPRKDGSTMDNVSEGRAQHQRSSRVDPRKILLTIALMACMATMGILYYRLAQRSLGESISEDEPQ